VRFQKDYRRPAGAPRRSSKSVEEIKLEDLIADVDMANHRQPCGFTLSATPGGCVPPPVARRKGRIGAKTARTRTLVEYLFVRFGATVYILLFSSGRLGISRPAPPDRRTARPRNDAIAKSVPVMARRRALVREVGRAWTC